MANRYELSDAAWDLVAEIFDEPRLSVRLRTAHLLMLNGVLWGLCSGDTWRDQPERLGSWSTEYQRLSVIGAITLKRLHIERNE